VDWSIVTASVPGPGVWSSGPCSGQAAGGNARGSCGLRPSACFPHAGSRLDEGARRGLQCASRPALSLSSVRFDALQAGARVLWEIKTHRFDTYPDFIQDQEIEKEIEQLREERQAAQACGYDFVVGVSTQAHKDALLRADRFLKVVVTGCKR
jgi:hypothetical protein